MHHRPTSLLLASAAAFTLAACGKPSPDVGRIDAGCADDAARTRARQPCDPEFDTSPLFFAISGSTPYTNQWLRSAFRLLRVV